ncbi:teichuronic acid biosynthesis protein TuaE [Bacillus sp. UNC438CL73TsuS30]|uniref:teichuronic acid biosynthesis protein TuaE n=1 Tax=Bacillus sp. UNC438CL73TsuS30 TaxID=1340434 RepID=UPI00068F4283|nr:O-antigen ligase family protein [Bacillus sp. UNC438CL73TsuS30]
MEGNNSVARGVGTPAFLMVRPYVETNRLFCGVMFLLVATTFLNQSVLSIHFGFFSLFLYRLILISAATLFIVSIVKEKNLSQYWKQIKVKEVLHFLMFWLVYGTVSLLWAKSYVDGIKYLFLLGTGILFVFLAVFTFTKISRLLVFYGIWLFMTLILLCIGLINHFTHIQLPSSTLYGGPEYKLSYPTAVFFNQNDFATFLTISFSFYAAAAKNSRNVWIKTSTILLGLLCVYIIYLTESRASLLGVFVGLIFYLFIHLPSYLKKVTLNIGLIAMVLCSVFFFNKVSNIIAANDGHSSNVVRLNLLKNAFHFILDTFGFGVGAGNIPYYLKNEAIYDTNHVVEVHNWLMEILGNFGIIIFLGYLFMYVYLFCCLYKAFKKTRDEKEKGIIEACMIGQIAFLISSISPSSVSNLYFHWVFLGFVIATVNVYNNKNRKIKSENKRRSKLRNGINR